MTDSKEARQSLRGVARLNAKTVADAEAAHCRRLGIASLDTPLPVVAADVAAARFEWAATHTASPSEQIAYRLDAWLVTHPDVCATADDYPDWPAQFAAIKAAHSSTSEETR